MSYQCERCGKGIMHGHRVSHAKNRTNRLFRPNLQTLRVPDMSGIKHKTTLCSSCVRIVRQEVQKVQEVQNVREASKEVQEVQKIQ
ncbi:MAG: 50S ribosomal protein L28 [Candidatus Chisholmbacteria bacterium]|nr:50S ribosomal protein L28 [Candidatus Chisholmbacteria bacterium]